MDADLIIIGAGPAGLTAAQYGARANLKVLVIEQIGPGGQALLIDTLENYPGNIEQKDASGKVLGGVKSGYEFSMDLHKQAEAFGAVFYSGSVVSLKKEGENFNVILSDGKILKTYAVIIATGAKPRLLDVPGEKEFTGKGVSYCATCDGNFYRGKKVIVVGGGDAACDEARYLSRLTDKITLVHRREGLRAQKAIADRMMNDPNIKKNFNKIVKEIKGAQKVKSVILEDTKTGEVFEEETDAVFIFAGTVPQSDLAADLAAKLAIDSDLGGVIIDEDSYIITDQKMATGIAGLFAAGDVRSGAFRQVITACADGAVAAHSAAEYIDNIGG
jgi:thioredoxin reductase (NADPH)